MSRSLLAAFTFATLFSSTFALAQSSDPRFQVRAVIPLTGQSQPREVFRVDNAGGFFADGELGVGTMPISGEGYRTLWYPYKGGFRTGGVSADQWDEAKFGFFSFAAGWDTTASGLYSVSMGDGNSATSNGAIAMGVDSNASGPSSGSAVPVAIGYQNNALESFATALGSRSEASGVSSIAFGFRVQASGDNSMALGNRVTTNGRTGAFIWGDSSTSETSYTSMFASSANNEFSVRAAGGIRLRTNASLTTGCNLPAGSGVFTCTSDRNTKENFRSEDPESVLAKLVKLEVTSWNYKTEDKASRHLGPMAQDFYSAFKLGNDEKSIGHTDLVGVNTLAIQALEKRSVKQADRISELEAELKTLREENRALRSEREEVDARLERIERLVFKNAAKQDKQLSRR